MIKVSKDASVVSICKQYLICVLYFVMNLNIVQCLYVNNALYVYNCMHEKGNKNIIKPSCIFKVLVAGKSLDH